MQGRRPRLLAWGLVLLSILLLAFLYRAPAVWVWETWWTDDYYTHGALVALVAVALAAWRLRKDAAADAPPAWAPLGLLAAGALYLAGFLRHSAHLMTWSFLALLAGVALATGGPARLRRLSPPILLGALVLPFPWMGDVGAALQSFSFAASSAALRGMGLAIEPGLTTFRAGGVTFDVTPACSGLQSALSLLAVGALLVALVDLPRARRRLVLLGAVPLALGVNVLRILAAVGLALTLGPQSASGVFHATGSAVVFLLETLILIGMAGLLRRKEATHGTG